jgi:DNA-binding IclR family transcriptional regulator
MEASEHRAREGSRRCWFYRHPQGEIVASVGISSPVTRLHAKLRARGVAEVVAMARAVSASLAS